MNARFFYAPACFSTWPKLFVLTSDNKMHCKFLDYMRPTELNMTLDFNNFNENDFKWSGYQALKEVTKEEALTAVLIKQNNWISDYLTEKGVK